MSNLLECQGLVAGYLNRPVLHGISLNVPPGGVVAVIGPNGHGKTTALRSFSGLLPLRGGELHFDGQDITRASVHARVEAGLIHVPQGDQLFAEMTVEENLLMGAYLVSDDTTIARRLERVYSMFPKLANRQHQIANGLSGGERRMVGIGRGLMADTKLLMLDEPSLGLAPLVIEQIYDALAQLRDAGMSFLVVEENPSRIMQFANQICLIDAGNIAWTGTPEDAQKSRDILATYLGGH